MPGISNETRVVFWIIAETGLGIFGILGSVLAINFVYSLSKKGRPPTRRSTLIWIMFSGGFILFIVFGALSNFAPALPNEGDNTLDTIATPQYSSNSIRLIPIEEQNIVVKLGSKSLSPGEVIPLNETITVMFKILNNGTSPVTINALVIGSRGPGVNCENPNLEKWSAPDMPFPTPRNITIQPGEEYEYQGSRAFYLPGKYFLEPIIQGPSGNWGGIQPFSCVSITVDGTQSPQTTTPTPSDTPLPTNTAAPTIPPTDIVTPTFAPTAVSKAYSEGEAAFLREDVYVALRPNLNNPVGSCGYDGMDWGVAFDIVNNSPNQFLLRFNNSTFSATDDQGTQYNLYKAGFSNNIESVLGVDINYGVGYHAPTILCVNFNGHFPPQASYLLIKAEWISGVGPITFMKRL